MPKKLVSVLMAASLAFANSVSATEHDCKFSPSTETRTLDQHVDDIFNKISHELLDNAVAIPYRYLPDYVVTGVKFRTPNFLVYFEQNIYTDGDVIPFMPFMRIYSFSEEMEMQIYGEYWGIKLIVESAKLDVFESCQVLGPIFNSRDTERGRYNTYNIPITGSLDKLANLIYAFGIKYVGTILPKNYVPRKVR